MERHLHLFNTESEFNEVYNGSGYTDPWVSYTKETSGVTYNKAAQPPHDYSQDYLTLEILSSGSIVPFNDGLYYSLDDGQTWNEFISSVNVANGDKFMLKGDNIHGEAGSNGPFIVQNCNLNVFGNIMSIVYSTGFATATTLPVGYDGLNSLFYNCSGLISAENLVLPATTLEQSCYGHMFYGCTNLTTAPSILPATTLAYDCYYEMFEGCTSLTTAPSILPATTLVGSCYGRMFTGCASLTTAPELPATTLADWCYRNMFEGCTSLTTAPELPATTLTERCYENMFNGCSSLNNIKCLATDISASYCTDGWVDGVASAGTFVKNPSMSSWTTGNNGIPNNWTVEDAS